MIDLHALHSVADISRHQARVNGDRIARWSLRAAKLPIVSSMREPVGSPMDL
jgi:hypothetical protein